MDLFLRSRCLEVTCILSEIKELSSSIQLEFKHMGRSANGMAAYLAKQGIDMEIHMKANKL